MAKRIKKSSIGREITALKKKGMGAAQAVAATLSMAGVPKAKKGKKGAAKRRRR
jgi:hypothetical protein